MRSHVCVVWGFVVIVACSCDAYFQPRNLRAKEGGTEIELAKVEEEHFEVMGCEMPELKSHKTVCCADLDLPAFGGIDIVELTKGCNLGIEVAADKKAQPDNTAEIEEGPGRRLEVDSDIPIDSEEGMTLQEERETAVNEEEFSESDAEAAEDVSKESPFVCGEKIPVLGSKNYATFMPTSVGMFKLYFSSEENRGLFLANPWFYMPQYGGFAADGFTDPKAKDPKYVTKLGPYADLTNWSVIDGKLYFFSSLKGKGQFLAANMAEETQGSAITLANEAWGSYYSGGLTDGYINTNCFARTSWKELADGTAMTEAAQLLAIEAAKAMADGAKGGSSGGKGGQSSGGGGGGGGDNDSGSSNGGEALVVYEAPPSLRDRAHAMWEAETLEEILSFERWGAREMTLELEAK